MPANFATNFIRSERSVLNMAITVLNMAIIKYSDCHQNFASALQLRGSVKRCLSQRLRKAGELRGREKHLICVICSLNIAL